MVSDYYKKPYLDEPFDQYLGHLKKRWVIVDNKLRHEFKFKNFRDAIAFVNSVADLAEKENHHPAISISHDSVLIELYTHKEDKITHKDFELAQKIEEILK